MSAADEYELVVTPPAARAITEQLPEPVAAAVSCHPDRDVGPLAGVALGNA